MLFAKDSNGDRISIENADPKRVYYCPLCDGELVQKHGSQKIHHFAHKAALDDDRYSCDGWSNDMSEWHIDWQDAFPEECREVVVEKEGIRHRADVLINNVVIEFQHSPISIEEFQDRNDFYRNDGRRVIWIFDMTENYEAKRIEPSINNSDTYTWKWPSKLFSRIDLKGSSIELFFQIQEVHGENYGLEKVIWFSQDLKTFRTELGTAYSQEEFVEYVTQPVANNQGKTIQEIIDSCEYKVIGVIKLTDGTRVKIGTAQFKGGLNSNRVIMGYLGRSNSSGYFDDRREIFNADKTVWKLEWGY